MRSSCVRTCEVVMSAARRPLTWLILSLLLSTTSTVRSSVGAQSLPRPAEHPEGKQLIDRYCVTCHNQRLKTGGLTLDNVDVRNPAAAAPVWEKVIRKLRAGMMPPAGRPHPDPQLQDAFVGWLESRLDQAAAAHPNPGRTETFHRLNRSEYRNAVRDLLGLDIDVASLLPADDAS